MNDAQASLYLDLCCLNRPFDDQSQARIHLESEAILLILGRVEMGLWRWVGSEALDLEIAKAPDPEMQLRLHLLTAACSEHVPVTPPILQRREFLQTLGLKAYDALHLACAESAAVDVLLTTDDRMIAAARRNADEIRVTVRNPIDWLGEVL